MVFQHPFFHHGGRGGTPKRVGLEDFGVSAHSPHHLEHALRNALRTDRPGFVGHTPDQGFPGMVEVS